MLKKDFNHSRMAARFEASRVFRRQFQLVTCSPFLYQSYVESGVVMVPLQGRLRNPHSGGGGRQPADAAMRSHMVVIVAPAAKHRPGMAYRREQRLVQALVAQATINRLLKKGLAIAS